MATLARQGVNDIRPIALDLVTQSGCNRVRDCILVIDRWLRAKFVYRREKDEVLRTVPFMVNDLNTKGNMEGDCDDMTICAAAMFLAVGIQPRMTAIRSTPAEFDHVFCEALDGSAWVPVDPTVPYGMTYKHFGMAFQAV